jgi:hypothetical protein
VENVNQVIAIRGLEALKTKKLALHFRTERGAKALPG